MSARDFPLEILTGRARFTPKSSAWSRSRSAPGGLRYQCGNGHFSLFQSAGVPSGEHTQMAWEVEDLDAVVEELRRRGVVFEDVDLPGLRTVDGIAEVVGNYPSAGGVAERAAWFRDSEGNLLGIGQPVRKRKPKGGRKS